MPQVILGARRRRAEDVARAHLEQSRRDRDEVERVTAPLLRDERLNHLAARVERSLRGHT